MAENTNQSIFIINQQGGYDSTQVTQAEYDAWAQDNAVTALDPNGNTVDIVGGDNKISVTDGNTTVGFDNVQQPGDGTGTTSYSTAVTDNDTITTDDALAFLQQTVTDAIALKESIIANLDSRGIDPDTSVVTIRGQQAYTLDAAEAAIDGAYAALYAYKDNLPALITELQDIGQQLVAEYRADVEAGEIIRLPKDIGPVDGQTTSTTVDTTGSTVASSSILSLADATTDTTLPTIDQGNTAIQTVEVTANTSVSKAIRDSLGLPNQGPIVEKLISKAIDLGLNQIPGYPQISSAIGTANRVVQVGDIITNVDQTPAEAALALARLFVPQINLVVTGFNLISAGGSGGAAEILEPIPVNTTVDIQAGGAGEEEDPPPGGIDFGPVAVDTNTDPQAGPTTIESNTAAFQDANLIAIAPVGNFAVAYNVETGTYDVYNLDTNEIVAGGFTQAQATEYADALNVGDDFEALNVQGRADAEARLNTNPADVTEAEDPSLYPNGLPYDDDGNLNPGWALDENNNPVYVGGDFVEPATQALANLGSAAAARVLSLKQQANSQATIAAQRKQANDGDWRVKLRLAEGADYLYRDPKLNEGGVLWPLTITNGVVFPYTPTISTNYAANYSTYDLTHSNYRGVFYQNSYVDEVNITATFTAQDTSEANYMLAVIHFFRSATKMFYGQDPNRGQPPPLVFLQGLGEYQFNLHPCVIRSFNYNLPADVDYIRARSVSVNGTNLLGRRDRASLPNGPSWLSNIRLGAAGLNPGGINPPPAPPTLGIASPTYVPTKLDITITLLPVQSRSQVSKQFSLKQFANGDLIKGGFW